MPPLQSVVRSAQAVGIIGEMIVDGPWRCQPYQIDPNATAADCVVGRVFTLDPATGLVIPGAAGAVLAPGTRVLAGIAVMPKEYASSGSTAGTLAPTLLLQPGSIYEFMTMGVIYAAGPTASKVGDPVSYNWTTGVIAAYEGATPANSNVLANAIVDRVSSTTPGTYGVMGIRLTN